MVQTVSYKDPGRLELIRQLESASNTGANVWSSVAKELSRVRRNRREVNIRKLDKYTSDGDVVVVPGKVLGDGFLNHKIVVAAYQFTDGAEKKIIQAGGEAMSISSLLERNPKGSKIKIMG
ncbi:MAG: 50S ribosomal protein L18e [Candidatus Altiarchaeota archaeon]